MQIAQSNLRELLLQCCMDDAHDVKQSAFALLGDLAKVCPIHLHPRLSEFLDVAAKQLNTSKLRETISVANNACWAIGELAIKVRQEVTPVVMTVISSLVLILKHSEELNKSLIENSAITLGRLAWVCPELVAPHMEHFMQSWCIALSMIRDDIEKEDAFRGLCAMVKVNPSGALSSLVFMCRAIASWHEIRSEELHNDVCQVLHGYKQVSNASNPCFYAEEWCMGPMHVSFGAPCKRQAVKISSIILFWFSYRQSSTLLQCCGPLELCIRVATIGHCALPDDIGA
ncbi:hypothetical protein Pint_34241 [Pistacia integerrima]|uniref:Uncharacterized protein n=1 Tax=Pistacia integerrima TaxID=434235 RepID=A0ACC0X904_9ROSI|nr:hypothetical protein Pint_34241 [Pistacia integerrima]